MNFWDEKYSQVDYLYGEKPNDFLKEESHIFKPKSKILSLGEGEGRNALFLAGLGHELHCIDISIVGKEKTLNLFHKNNLKVNYEVCDLKNFTPVDKYDGIVSIWCHMPKEIRQKVYQDLYYWLNDEGLLLIEGYTVEQLSFGTGGPKDLSLLYTFLELEDELKKFKKIIFREVRRDVQEGVGHSGMSATLQILCKK